MSKILVVAAHPDDEILGVGATVAKRIKNGDTVKAIILGEGQTSRGEKRTYVSSEIVDELHKDTLRAAKCVGYKEVFFANFPDNRFDSVDLLDIVKYIEKINKEFKPDIVYTHHGGDLNIDHQITYKAVLTANRPVNDYFVKEIYTFETLSSTEWNFAYDSVFTPNVFEDVSEFMQCKYEAMKCYNTELCDFPHPRSLKGMEVTAQKWGSVVGKQYVEPFTLIRKVN